MRERETDVRPSQPIGIGFSALANRSAAATSLAAGARDLHAFLSVLTTDVFPQLRDQRWHFAGESFGGRWTTAYAAHVLAHQQEPGLRIASVVAVDGSVDPAYSSVGLYGFFCANGGAPLMNETACGAMGAGVAECEDAGRGCREAYDGGVCEEAEVRCWEGVGRYFWEGVRPGGWNPYDSGGVFFFHFLLLPGCFPNMSWCSRPDELHGAATVLGFERRTGGGVSESAVGAGTPGVLERLVRAH